MKTTTPLDGAELAASGSPSRADTILVVEDSPTIAQLVAAKLRAAGYETEVVADGFSALDAARERTPDLILCDVIMPGLDGFELTRKLRRDVRTAAVSIIMCTSLGNVMEGLDAGADDYVIKPFNDLELLARIKAVLRRNREMRAISPLTGMPGNHRIEDEIERRIKSSMDFAVMYADVDNFKPYNDHYGFARGDDVLKATARLIQDVAFELGGEETFVGHVGGDDFIAVTHPDLCTPIAETIIERFDARAPSLYDPKDAAHGYIESENRLGKLQRFQFVSISVGMAWTVNRKYTHYAEAVAVASEMKSFTKKTPGSSWAVDRRIY
jgi:diguanylate cyclase (GGDEF)-like protein